ncbi:MAG: NUDIX domain-containing protein [Chloroflexia bacterium]
MATTAFVQDDRGRVLLIRRSDSGRWALPGGGQEIGESVADSASRETREESGVEIVVTGLVGIYSNPHHVIAYSNGEVRQQFSICLRAEATGGRLRPSNESTDVRWVSSDELDALNIHPEMRLRIDHGWPTAPSPTSAKRTPVVALSAEQPPEGPAPPRL